MKPLAQKLPAFVKDTTDLLNKIEEVNKEGPFPPGTLLVSWDVLSMFPNIDNNFLGLKAVRKAVESRQVQSPSTDCLLGAVELCLQNNNSQFGNLNFLQCMGTAMSPKNVCSYADLAMGEIDELAKNGHEIKPMLWWRYRDDIVDLWVPCLPKLLEFTDFINALYPTI